MANLTAVPVAGGWGAARTGPLPPAALLDRPITPARSVVFCAVSEPAVVAGRATSLPEAQVPVVRRRSGGNAVWVAPGEFVWADVTIPRGDALWDDDVNKATWWVGEAWVAALRAVGVDDPMTVHHGPVVCRRWCDHVCFAGIGPGEVTIGEQVKIVGISQRRTRDAALFQCAVLLHWDPAPLVAALGLPPSAVGELANVAGAVPGATDGSVLEAAFVDVLGRLEA